MNHVSLRGLKQRFKRLAALAVSAIVVLSAAPSQALAYVRPDVARKTSLEIYCHKSTAEFGNVTFKAYKVADMNDLVRFSFSENFKAYEETIELRDDMTGSEWVSMADVLAGFVERDKVLANRTSTTDEKGRLKWEELDTGLYLVVGETFERETVLDGYRTKIYYKTAPFMIALPSLVEDEWVYDVTVSPKSSPSPEGDSSRRLLKVWDDNGYEGLRPQSLTFDLLQDGEVKETVKLTAENNWRYQWDGLDNRYTWRIVERATGNYQVSTATEGITYVVTNRYYRGPGSGGGGGSSGGGGGSGGGGSSSGGGPGAVPSLTEIFGEDTPLADMQGTDILEEAVPAANWPLLPQTGQLWWPVPVLAGAGMLTFIMGWILRRKEHEN